MSPNHVTPGHFFLPGPTEVHPAVLAAQAQPMIGHRDPEIHQLIAALQGGLRAVFGTERPVLISTSSATGLMEAAVRNGVLGGKVLSLVNGGFSARFADIARSCGFDVVEWRVPWGQVHNPEELHRRIGGSGFDAITVTHSETSTGALQDLPGLAKVVSEHRPTMLLVDSVTGVGGTEVLTDAWDIDFILTGSQKALALPPGLAFAVAGQLLLERSAASPSKGWYFDLVRLSGDLARSQTPATPAVSLLYATLVQLQRIGEEGLERRWRRHSEMSRRTGTWVEEMVAGGVAVRMVAPEGSRSPTVSAIELPPGVGSGEFVGRVRESGWVVGTGYGELSATTFRIGHMGDHTLEELEELLQVLTAILR